MIVLYHFREVAEMVFFVWMIWYKTADAVVCRKVVEG